MRNIILILIGLILIIGLCSASTQQDTYLKNASNLYGIRNNIACDQSIQANYWMLRAILEEEKKQTAYLLRINQHMDNEWGKP